MKIWVPKIVSPVLALLVLLSTVSWSVNKHLCMGRVIDVAFFHDADTCGMMGLSSTEEKTTEDKVDKNGCCSDEEFTITGQDNLDSSWDSPVVQGPLFTAPANFAFLEVKPLAIARQVSKVVDPPPLLNQDINILHQVFLI